MSLAAGLKQVISPAFSAMPRRVPWMIEAKWIWPIDASADLRVRYST